MKKILLILFIIPAFIYAQDTPLIEQRVTTDKMFKENQKDKDKEYKQLDKTQNRSFAMHPKDQIGYIINIPNCPYGLTYYKFINKNIGLYADFKFGSQTHPTTVTVDDVYVASEIMTSSNIINGGVALPLARKKKKSSRRVIILYLGFGAATQSTTTWNYFGEAANEVNTYGNFNFGILRQTNALISWQIGFDTAVPGINFGMGFTWK